MNKSGFLFDMDGLLVNSEPYWQMVEKRVFGAVGVELSDDMLKQTTGLRCMDVATKWFNQFRWQGRSIQQVHDDIIGGMAECFKSDLQVMPGAVELVRKLAAEPDNRVAICSGSPMVLIDTAIEVMGIADCIDVRHTTTEDAFGKPHPLPYLNCAERVERTPQRCVVFEDSVTGCISGKAAGMTVVAVPDGPYNPEAYTFCDQVLESLADFRVSP